MHEPQAAASSSSCFDFASLLASLASAAKKPEAWDNSALADDIATISYEQALRAHTRGRVGEGELPALPFGEGEVTRGDRSAHGATSGGARKALSLPIRADATRETSSKPHSRSEGCRLAASVTIRLRKAECVQLQERANEAGLTVSAYLRSCVFEAEALRAQVREALVQFRSAGSTESVAPQNPAVTHSLTWRARLFSRWSHGADIKP